jgi:hypothetical protein
MLKKTIVMKRPQISGKWPLKLKDWRERKCGDFGGILSIEHLFHPLTARIV